MKERLHEALVAALRRLLEEAGDVGDPPEFALEVPRNPEHGDFACNAAMLLAKRLSQPPRQIAERLIAELGDAEGLVDSAQVAGPGFVNLRLGDARWQDLLRAVLLAGEAWGRGQEGGGRSAQVEFVSANPTGPLTLGHGRQGVLGDCVARLLQARGWNVTREYYFNNGGRQMRVLGESVRARYLEQLGRAAAPPEEAFAEGADWPETIDGLDVVFPKDGYQGAYIGDIAARIREREGEGWLDEPGDGRFRLEAQAEIFAGIQKTLAGLDIVFDVYSKEGDLYADGAIERALEDLRGEGLVYDQDGAVWLRSTSFGLDRDRVLVKSTGEPTYLLPDIAYHREKFARGFERIIDVQGADHFAQFPFVTHSVGALGCDADAVELVMHQFVTLTSDGKQVKQSTRRATYVTVDELLEDVGADVFRVFMVQRKADGHLDFDLDLARETDWTKNPAYYLQYAYARTHGIERKAGEWGAAMPGPDDVEGALLSLPEEVELLKKLGEFPELVQRAADMREPHQVVYYLRELAGLWNPYIQDGTRHRVLSDDAALTSARLGLTLAVRTVLGNGLRLLGVSAPERM
jgi:arginyl-tRNA synthetase